LSWTRRSWNRSAIRWFHLIRNSVDHGFEPPAERLAHGKNPSGQLTLRAVHEAGSVSIEVKDDGRGLDAMLSRRKLSKRDC